MTAPTTAVFGARLDRSFFDRPVLDVAADLLGRVIVHQTDAGLTALRVTEVEAYDGPNDPGSHAYRGRTPRNAIMYGEPGHVYVYFTYGMHYCANLVCGPRDIPSAVLLRAGEIIVGEDLATLRRPTARAARELARGPARLVTALGIGGADNGQDAVAGDAIMAFAGSDTRPGAIRTGPRVGLAAAADRPWRFWVDGDVTVSPYRAHTPRRRAAQSSRAATPPSGRL